MLHASEPIEYPSFGGPDTPYAPPPEASRLERSQGIWVRDFYAAWTDFNTAKRFEWVAKWDVERGDDRSMRRLMEKENKKIRDDYKREYVDTVRVRNGSDRKLTCSSWHSSYSTVIRDTNSINHRQR